MPCNPIVGSNGIIGPLCCMWCLFYSPWQRVKFEAILLYFEALSEAEPTGLVTYTRKVRIYDGIAVYQHECLFYCQAVVLCFAKQNCLG